MGYIRTRPTVYYYSERGCSSAQSNPSPHYRYWHIISCTLRIKLTLMHRLLRNIIHLGIIVLVYSITYCSCRIDHGLDKSQSSTGTGTDCVSPAHIKASCTSTLICGSRMVVEPAIIQLSNYTLHKFRSQLQV